MAPPSPITVLPGPTISAGQSLSSALDCSAGALASINMPLAWDNANITIQVSADGVTYYDLFDPIDGSEVTLRFISGAMLPIPLLGWAAVIRWLKLRSGSRDYPVPQTADRVFSVSVIT